MADRQKEQFEQPGFQESGAGNEGLREAADQAARPENAMERPQADKEGASKIRERIENKPAKSGSEVAGAEKSDKELAREKYVQKRVMEAISAGENFDEVEKIFNAVRAKAEEYPGVVDEVHDRYVEERNLKNGGMY